MKVKTGSYTGTGVDGFSVSGIGFTPQLVIIKNRDTAADVIFKTDKHPGLEASHTRGDLSNETNLIKSLDSGGFTLGDGDEVNSGATFVYVAIADDGMRDFATFTYVGDATDGRAITGIGFKPDFVASKPNMNKTGAYRFSNFPNSSMWFGGADRTDLFASFDADGFTINNGSASGDDLVNNSGVDHYGFCFRESPNRCKIFRYVGDSSDNRNITLIGFTPGFVWLKSDNWAPCMRTTSFAADSSCNFDEAAKANTIQNFIYNGIQVGTDASSNLASEDYRGLAIYEPDQRIDPVETIDLRPAIFTPGIAR